MADRTTRRKALLMATVTVFLIAVILIAYSLVMIIGANLRAREREDEWNALLNQQSDAVSAESDSPESTGSDTVSGPASEAPGATSAPATPSPATKPSGPYKPTLLGQLTFHSLNNKKVVVVEGTTKADLRGAAGHAPYSAPPGRTGNSIIFGHRDGVFLGFKDLNLGDTFQIKTLKGTFTYRIISMTIVPPNDPLISKRYMTPVMTLVTCYPFRYTGNAPNRYVVVSELVP